MNRRHFNKLSLASLTTLAMPSIPSFLLDDKLNTFGVQLYTLRDDMAKDAVGTLAHLAKLGYQEVELAGYNNRSFYDMKPKAFKQLLDDNGLSAPSGHTKTGFQEPDSKNNLLRGWEQLLEDAATIGQKNIVLAYLFEGERQSNEDYYHLTDRLNVAGEQAAAMGITLCYHNHDFEFMPFNEDEMLPYDILLKNVDEDKMKMELDLYWIIKAGHDPIQYFKNYPNRFPLWHVKDMTKDERKFFTEVGEGSIDWKPIFAEAKTAGMKHFFVEQDVCENHAPKESVEISLDYLLKMKY